MKQISTDMILQRHQHGVMLARSEVVQNRAAPNLKSNDIQSCLESPYEFFMMDPSNRIILVNNNVAITCGADSNTEMTGQSPARYFDKSSANLIKKYDENVLCHQRMQFDEYDLIRKDESISHYMAIRMPLYDEYKNMIGVVGYSLILGRHSFSKFITDMLNQHAPFVTNSSPYKFDEIYLSLRERQCLQLLIRGKTMREIAVNLTISPRTVECYVENLKTKFGVKRKSELIDSAFDYFYPKS
jgi:DNA-binding CsgD family transcriptional regulator